MVITFILHTGKKVEISDLDDNANWLDAAEILFDNELINEEDLILLEENPASHNPISDSGNNRYNFSNQQFSGGNAEESARPKLKKKSDSENITQSQPSSGLKKKSSANNNPASPVKANKLKKKQSQPSPPKKKQEAPAPMPSPPKPRRDIKYYEMEMNCSKTGKKWTARLQGLTPPSKSSSQSNPKPVTPENRNVYLCLDDSWSMDGDAMSQLKSAVISFLNERPENEKIHVLTFNNTASYTGVPSGARSAINSMYPTNGTPMSSCLNRIPSGKTSSKQNNDVVILFSDGAPDSPADTTSSASRVKSRVKKLISIGCGSGVDKNFMTSLASTPADYHHASNPGQILAVFQQVARSIAQTPVVSGAKKTGNHSRAKQVGVVSNTGGNSSSRYQVSSKLQSNEGFEIIEDFKCDGCGSNGRARCVCGVPLCQGGLRDMGKGNRPMMTCPVCGIDFELDYVETLHATTQGSGGKKK